MIGMAAEMDPDGSFVLALKSEATVARFKWMWLAASAEGNLVYVCDVERWPI